MPRRPATARSSAEPFARLPAARIPLVVGIWIEPASDPGHGAHLDPTQTLLDLVREEFPATPVRLLVPPGVAQATWLPDLAAGRGFAVSVTEEVDREAPDIVTLARHARIIVCLSPAPQQSPDTRHLIRWKRQGHREIPTAAAPDREVVPAGPIHFWDLSRAGQARPERLRPKPGSAAASFRATSRHVRAYNRRAGSQRHSLAAARQIARAALTPPDVTPPLSPALADAVERHTENAALAAGIRPLATGSRIGWRCLAGAATALLVTVPERPGLVAFAVTAAWILRAWHRHWSNLAQSHELLAETVGAHFVRSLAGLPALDPSALPAPYSLAAGWVHLAAAAWIRGLGEPDAQGSGTPVPGHLRCLQHGWIAARRRRLEQDASDREARASRLRKIARPAAAAVLLSIAGWLGAGLVPGMDPTAPWWAGGTAALGLLTALVSQSASRHDLEAQRRRRELRTLEDMATDLETAGSGSAGARTILRMTDAALHEQADRAALESPGTR